MAIVDSHAHLGPCRVFGLNNTVDMLLEYVEQNEIDQSVVQPYPGAPDPRKVHDDIARLASDHPRSFFGLASMNPHTDPDVYFKEIERCVRELNFVAVKLHTIGHAVSPLSQDADTVFQAARDLGIPVMVHTGMGIPFASPALVIPKAREYPSVPIILAHAGYAIYTMDAYVTATECPNVYLETSWCTPHVIKFVIDKLGADRVMFGSDLCVNAPVEMAKARAIGLEGEQKDKYLGITAAKVYKLPDP
ncbi:MAG: amidohydrolase family protein [Candidatus Binatia bacterium]